MEHRASRILLVEDEPTLSRIAGRALKAAGFIVDYARDGADGVERLGEREYDVVVSDVNMPRLTGLDLLVEANRLQPGLPVVLMTAQLDAEAYGRALDMGSVRYLLKPIGIQQLGPGRRRRAQARRGAAACPAPQSSRHVNGAHAG